MDGLWSEFVSAEASSGHAVHVHRDAAELAAGVGEYLAAGLDAAEPCVVVATAANRRGFAEELSARGWSPARIAAEATLVEADAESTLEAVTADGRIARVRRAHRGARCPRSCAARPRCGRGARGGARACAGRTHLRPRREDDDAAGAAVRARAELGQRPHAGARRTDPRVGTRALPRGA